MDSPNDWLAWVVPGVFAAALIGLAIISFWPRPPRH